MNLAAEAVSVFTFKAGLLSRVAHDLHLRVDGATLTRDGDQVTGRFPVAGIRVERAVSGGSLSASDRAKIERTMRDEILHAGRFPTVTWAGSPARDGDTLRFEGALTLHGQTHPAAFAGRLEAGALVADAWLTPSRWGIPPYKALLGAIQLQDRVRVSLRIPDWG